MPQSASGGGSEDDKRCFRLDELSLRAPASFCLATPPAFVVFEAPASGVERISDRYMNILLLLLEAHDEITSRNAQADPDIEEVSAPMVVVGTVHPDTAVLNMA